MRDSIPKESCLGDGDEDDSSGEYEARRHLATGTLGARSFRRAFAAIEPRIRASVVRRALADGQPSRSSWRHVLGADKVVAPPGTPPTCGQSANGATTTLAARRQRADSPPTSKAKPVSHPKTPVRNTPPVVGSMEPPGGRAAVGC
jgi:hypothetical protein